MSETFIISDTHFGHSNSLTFKRKDGSLLRDFSCVEEMDEHMVQQWNSVVKPNDKVIHLGDVVINKRCLGTLARLNGKKKLVLGNHDIFDHSEYAKYFYEQKAYRVFDGCIFSHIPVHSGSKGRFLANIHGHLHDDIVTDEHTGLACSFYICCCVEQPYINYTPIPWYRVKEIIAQRT